MKQEAKISGGVSVDARVYKEIARIEQAQISRARADSIGRFTATDDSSYLVQKSHAVRAAQAELDPVVSLRVQDAIDSLAGSVRQPEGASGDSADVLWLLVPDTRFEIGYSIDDAVRRLRVVALRCVADSDGSTPEKM